MNLLRKFGTALVIGVLFVLAFVVVCPSTPTPVGVLAKRGDLPNPAPLVMALAALPVIVAMPVVREFSILESVPVPSPAPVLALTCTLLC